MDSAKGNALGFPGDWKPKKSKRVKFTKSQDEAKDTAEMVGICDTVANAQGEAVSRVDPRVNTHASMNHNIGS